MKCIYCDNDVPEARVEIGKMYCMDKYCVGKGVSEAMSGFRLVLMPKQGFTYVMVDSDDMHNNNKSSGR
jgi:hypothetical protein